MVDIRITKSTLEIFLNRQRIASHLLCKDPGRSLIDDHMPIEHLRQTEMDPDALIEWANGIGPNVVEWVRANLHQRRDFANSLKSVRNLRCWAREERQIDRLDSGCAFAVKVGALTFQRLKTIIINRSDLRTTVESTAWVKDHKNIRGQDYYMQQGGLCDAE